MYFLLFIAHLSKWVLLEIGITLPVGNWWDGEICTASALLSTSSLSCMPLWSILMWRHFTPLLSYTLPIFLYPGSSTAITLSLPRSCTIMLYKYSVPAPTIMLSGLTFIPLKCWRWSAIASLNSITPFFSGTDRKEFSLSKSVCLIILDHVAKGKLSYIIWFELKSTSHFFFSFFFSYLTLGFCSMYWLPISLAKYPFFSLVYI